LLGATDKFLGDFFGVTERTIDNWKIKHASFFQALKNGKTVADAEVAHALYHRAIGYSHPDVHITNYLGDITITPLTKYYPPDTAAGFIWLKNRQGWRDRSEVEHSGLEGLVSALRASDEQMARDRAEAERFQSGRESDPGGGGDA